MRKLYFLILILAIPVLSVAQQDPQFSHYFFNQLYLNPAAAGSENVTRFQALYRMQYAGYQSTNDDGNAPTTQIVSANVPLKMIKSGIGLYYMNDNFGMNYNREIQLSYAYHIQLGEGQLGIGVKGGFFTKGIDPSKFRYNDLNDPSIPTTKVQQSALDLGAGLYYSSSTWNLGLSLNHINQPNFNYASTNALNTLNRSAYFTASTLIGLTYEIDLTPMFVLKTDIKTFSPEAGAIATYNNKVYFGASYRLNDAATAMAGINLLDNALRIGYAFDYVIAGINAKSNSSHEIMLSYALAPLRVGKKSIIRTPRYRY